MRGSVLFWGRDRRVPERGRGSESDHMRLICPNCGAQYEVPADAIPADGRDVQCSNCAHTWLELPGASEAAQAGLAAGPAAVDTVDDEFGDDEAGDDVAPGTETPADDPVAAIMTGAAAPQDAPPPAPVPETVPPSDPAPVLAKTETDARPVADAPARSDSTAREAAANARTPVRQPLSPTVAEILREEAAREAANRKGATADAFEDQPDLGLDRPLDREDQLAEEARRRMARIKGEAAPATSATVTQTSGARSELLPDIEEINSSLRSTARRADPEEPQDEPEIAQERHRRGFRFGFFIAVLIFGTLALVYANAPRIADALPQTQPALSRYVDTVDAGRLWLDTQVQSWLAVTPDETPVGADIPADAPPGG